MIALAVVGAELELIRESAHGGAVLSSTVSIIGLLMSDLSVGGCQRFAELRLCFTKRARLGIHEIHIAVDASSMYQRPIKMISVLLEYPMVPERGLIDIVLSYARTIKQIKRNEQKRYVMERPTF
jgi:hypothetical protein